MDRRAKLAAEIAALEQASKAAPDDGALHLKLGHALAAARQYAAAEAEYRRATKLLPQPEEALMQRALMLSHLGHGVEGAALIEPLLAKLPGNPSLLRLMGILLREAERERAIGYLREAIALRPNLPVAHTVLGRILSRQGHSLDALDALGKALEIEPHSSDAVIARAGALGNTGRIAEAMASLEALLARRPENSEAWTTLLFIANYAPDISPAELAALYRRYGAQFRTAPLFERQWLPDVLSRRPLRIAFCSPDFRRHSVLSFLLPLLRNLQGPEFELHAFADVKKPDDATTMLKPLFTHWHDTLGLDDEAYAARIRDEGIAVAIDLAGHSLDSRLSALRLRPAPVQASWLGYGYTTGLDAIDWFIGDPVFTPPEADALFTEKVWRLPAIFAAFVPPDDTGPEGALPALRNGHVTFGCLSRSIRINQRVIACWARLLTAIPGARLKLNSFMMQDARYADELRQAFSRLGVAPERLDIAYTSPPWPVWREIDIALDCFPHNSGTTSYEALWMGVPLLTLMDRPPLGRMGASINQALHLPDWTAASEAEYIAKGIRFAADLPALTELRRGLRHRLQTSPLGDGPAFARDFSRFIAMAVAEADSRYGR